MPNLELQDREYFSDNGGVLAASNGELKWANDNWALKFDGTKLHHLNRGFTHQHDTDYGDFFYEALVKPLGTGYVLSTGYGGSHMILFGFSGSSAGYTLTGNVYDANTSTSYTVTTVADQLRHNEWAHIAFWGEGTKLGVSINGVPCKFVTCSGTRRINDEYDSQWYFGGSDHLNVSMVAAGDRLWEEGEGGIPYTNIHNQAVRPAIEHMPVAHLSNGAKACLIGDYRSRTLADLGNGLNGSRHNGFLSEATDSEAAGQVYTYNFTPQDTNRTALNRPVWVVDPFVYSGSAAQKTQIASSRIYCDFSGSDSHYGNSSTLSLGTCRVGGNSWTATNYGKLNGNMFCATTSPGLATITDSSPNGTVDVRKPSTEFQTGAGAVIKIIFRFTDSNNYSYLWIDEYGTGYWFHVVSGSETNAGSFTFGTGWTQAKIVMSGSSLQAYNGATLKSSFTMTQNQSATGKGIALNHPMLRISEFAVI